MTQPQPNPQDETSFHEVHPDQRQAGATPQPAPQTAADAGSPAVPPGAPQPVPGPTAEATQPQAVPGAQPAPTPQAPAAADEAGPGPRKRFETKAKAKAKPARRSDLATSNGSPRHQVESWLGVMVQEQASDLILRANGRPSLRVDGKIRFLPGRVPGPGPMQEIFEGILGERRLREWTKTGSSDAAIQLDGLGRFRINAYRQLGEPAMVIRRINEQAPNLDDLDLPAEDLKQLSLRKRGLILVTGIAGSGKSTSLAGMIQYMNQNVERHVVTLEDPVELMFQEDRCVISQREVGTDTTSFSDGLRHALRQSPDVIFIGEVRDATTVVAALEATETGHMVMSTMHTVNAAQTLDRILGFFPGERHTQIRQRLADNLAGVLSQRLVPRMGGGLIPAYELMIPTPHVRELIEEGQTTEMAKVIEGGNEAGLISFNECLRDLVQNKKVDLNDALASSDRPDELLLALRGIRGSSERVAGPQNNANNAPPRPPGVAGKEAGGGPGRRRPPGQSPDGLRLA